ncbi:protein containing Opine dehydrogenase domain protein [gut metagenome]|uniref:Protein containing Opine dehydrogenase domain protein n=1 Tax=gut metagenome TaxID=749906 RepID=J9FS66_9ZZZZ
MDAEFMQLLQVLPVTPGAIPSLLDYYESHDAASLTRKISSIPAFAPILSPMKEVEGGWIPDFSSRYFTEDFPYGLHYIWQLAKEKGIATPTIDKVYAWGIARMEKG